MESEYNCIRQGRDHQWFSALPSAGLVKVDWCVRCGVYARDNDKPHMVIKGERRVVEDVSDVQGLLG